MNVPLAGYLHVAGSFLIHPAKRKLLRLATSFRGKTGLEVGGPSPFFKPGQFPIYLFAERIDGVNFSHHTVWEGSLTEGQTYNYYSGKAGRQYIAEASHLAGIADKTYDFLLSCHSLEHVANPLQALQEWKRVLRPGGVIVLVLPDKEHSFDKYREYTPFSHLVADYEHGTDERDETHFEEIMRSHQRWLGSNEDITAVLQQNFTTRCAHHHVFHQQVVREMFTWAGFEVFHQQTARPFHLITLARLRNQP